MPGAPGAALHGDRTVSPALIVAGAVLLRLVLAVVVPLMPDETYYWEWSRHLAAGYFDHPPMIAWSIAAGRVLFGDSALGVRALPVVAGAVATAVGLRLAARTTRPPRDADAAWWAALLGTALPLAALGLVLATPDAPLVGFGAVTLLCVDRAVAAPRAGRATAWWAAAGVGLGLAITSKYMAVLIPAGVLAACVAIPALRRQLAAPGPWLAVVIAAVLFAPTLHWNATHGWPSFAFQLGHGLGAGAPPPAVAKHGSALAQEGAYIGGQLGLASPILAVMLVWACVVAVVDGFRARSAPDVDRRRARRALLAAVSLTVFAAFAVSALRRRPEPNWPALGYVPGVAVLAGVVAERRRRRWAVAAAALALLESGVLVVHALHPFLPLSARRDPVARGDGWDSLAVHVDADRRAGHAPHSWVAANRYQDASALAFHLTGRPFVPALNLASRHNQYDLWPSLRDSLAAGDDVLLVTGADPAPGSTLPPEVALLAPHFVTARVAEIVELQRRPGASAATLARGPVRERLRVWRLAGWRGGWP